MKKTRSSEEQMVEIPREVGQAPASEVAKKHGVSEVTIYAWRKRFGQLKAVDVKRPPQIGTENARLKKLLAERELEIEVLKDRSKKWWARWFIDVRLRMKINAACQYGELAC